MGNTDGQLTADLQTVAQHRHKSFYPFFCSWSAARAVHRAGSRCMPGLAASSSSGLPARREQALKFGRILQLPIQVMKATLHYTTIAITNLACLCLLAKEAACRKGPSQKLNACLQMQRYDIPSTEKSDRLGGSEKLRRPVAGLSFQLLLRSETDKGCRLGFGTASRVRPALCILKQHQATSLGVAAGAGDGAEPDTARPTTTSD